MSEDNPETDNGPLPTAPVLTNPLQISAGYPGGDSVTQYYSSPALGGNQWTSGEHAGNYVIAYNGYGLPGLGVTALTAYPNGQISINNNSGHSVPFDYQQGNFTPRITGSQGDPSTFVQAGNGTWSIVGNIVSINVSIDFTYTASAAFNRILMYNFPTTPVNLTAFQQMPSGITDGNTTVVTGYANPLTIAGTSTYPGYFVFTVGSGLGSMAEFQVGGSPGTQRIRFSLTYMR